MTRLATFLCIAFLLYLITFALVWVNRIAFIYPLDPTRTLPAQTGLKGFTEHSFLASDGTELIIWSKPPQPSRPSLIYFHGNAGNLAGRAYRFETFANKGYGIIALAYRGSGGSGGTPSETAITADAHQLYSAAKAGDFGWGPEKTIFYGESIGSGVAVKLAAETLPDALILEAPFTAVVDSAARQMPYFPVRWVLDERWESREYIKSVTAPLLILHGENDSITPIENGQTLFELSPSPDKTFEPLPDTGHSVWTEAGQQKIFDFLDRLK